MNQNQTHKPHLLIIAHGSRSAAWNHTIKEFVQHIHEINQAEGGFFSQCTACFLEQGSPSITDALQFLSQNEKRIIAVPFFLAPGVHVQQDVPKKVRNAGEVIKEEKDTLHVQIQDSQCVLLPHAAEPEVLAKNAIARYTKMALAAESAGLILVYYGSKRYPEIWEQLTKKIELYIKQKRSTLEILSVYAGDAVDFSPVPIMDAVKNLAKTCKKIVILPELYAAGVIQKEIIPMAIEQSGWEEKVVYFQDAILPDQEIAVQIWNTAKSYTSSSL